jgi:hypothetical protein
MISASSLQPKVSWLLLGWTGLEAEEEESPLEEDEEKVSWEPLSMLSDCPKSHIQVKNRNVHQQCA